MIVTMSISSGDTATWVGSIAVALTLMVTSLSVAADAWSRRRERRRGQAQTIAAWYAAENQLMVANSSTLPIYEVVVSMVFVQGAAPRTIEEWVANSEGAPPQFGAMFTALGPGKWSVPISGGWGAMMVRPSCEIGFTDAAGRHWIRRGTGELVAINKAPIDYYGFWRPVDFQAPVEA